MGKRDERTFFFFYFTVESNTQIYFEVGIGLKAFVIDKKEERRGWFAVTSGEPPATFLTFRGRNFAASESGPVG